MSFVWLKQYVPRGIYGRAALILLLPVVFLQLVVVVIFAQRHFEGVTVQMTNTVLRELAMVMRAVEVAPNRDAVAQQVMEDAGLLEISVEPVNEADIPAQNYSAWYDYSGSVMTLRLMQEFGPLLRVDLSNDRVVSLYVQSSRGPFRLEFDRRRISAANPHQLFVYTLSFGVILTVIASIYLRNQLRPIKRLARAAEAFGRGRNVPYSPSGALEIRAAGNAFVDMRNRIERHIEQRTLMLSGVSHDMRTPLTRMRLGLAMIEDEDAIELLRDVDDMQGMLDEFLNFAKGAGEVEREAVEPHEFVAQIVKEAQRGKRAVTLLPGEGTGKGCVKLRVVAMRRAIDNLISNAVRYGTVAEVSVMLSDKTLRIRVDDNGPGIPEERRIEATRPFTRLDRSRNQDLGGGVGLGLAIATDVARAHGGVLRLGEAPDLGGLRADIVISR